VPYLKPVRDILVGLRNALDPVREYLHSLTWLEIGLRRAQAVSSWDHVVPERAALVGVSGGEHTSIAGYSDRERSSTAAMVDGLCGAIERETRGRVVIKA
jgi:hypothetical protein